MQSLSLFEVVGDKVINHQFLYLTEKNFGSDPIERSFCKDNREESNAQNASPFPRVILSIQRGILKTGLVHHLL